MNQIWRNPGLGQASVLGSTSSACGSRILSGSNDPSCKVPGFGHDPSLGRVSSVVKVVILDRGGGCVNALALLEPELSGSGPSQAIRARVDAWCRPAARGYRQALQFTHQVCARDDHLHRLSRRGDGHLRQVGVTRSAHASRDPLRDGGDLPRLAAEGRTSRTCRSSSWTLRSWSGSTSSRQRSSRSITITRECRK